MQDQPERLKIGFTLEFYCENKRSRRKRSSFPTPLEGCQAYFNYRSFQCRRRTSFFHHKEQQNLFWPRLDPEMTLASAVIVKLAMEFESVETFNIPPEVLTATKSTT